MNCSNETARCGPPLHRAVIRNYEHYNLTTGRNGFLMKVKSCLPWYGSDALVADRLAALLDDCSHVTIPFVGGASIILHLKARAIVCNDANDLAINFYRVLSDPDKRDRLIQRCEATLSHPTDLQQAVGYTHGPAPAIDRAWGFWVQCWLSRKGSGGTSRTAEQQSTSVRWTANGGSNASRLRAASESLTAWAESFRRCEWSCLDFRQLARKLRDEPGCGSYWDPPWIDAGDRYTCSFTEQDHRDLRDLLFKFRKHKVLLRYGDDSLIRTLYSGWWIIEATGRTQANQDKPEIWVTNFDPFYDPLG